MQLGASIIAAIAMGLAPQVASEATPITYVIVDYDASTGVVEEAIVPDNDLEGASVFNLQAHPIPNAIQALVPVAQINLVGFTVALQAVAPGAVRSSNLANIFLLGETITRILAERGLGPQ